MKIRKYTENDRQHIVEIYRQSKLDELRYEGAKHVLLPLEQDRKRFSQLMESDIYVCEKNHVIAYGAHCGAEIRALFVAPDDRGGGVGRRLLEHLLSVIAKPATLSVAASNYPAILLYRQFMFEVVEEFEATYNGKGVKAYRMQQLMGGRANATLS
ncbi:hypothetical protein A9Q99_26315 [Gammaproteobacteria bacterium 45_16_T64]|nr:hypothetical protein A9Q99_26315 [Gammaproteobacteria bacterium 45_16_T64]